jgi:hypothetical protein
MIQFNQMITVKILTLARGSANFHFVQKSRKTRYHNEFFDQESYCVNLLVPDSQFAIIGKLIIEAVLVAYLECSYAEIQRMTMVCKKYL